MLEAVCRPFLFAVAKLRRCSVPPKHQRSSRVPSGLSASGNQGQPGTRSLGSPGLSQLSLGGPALPAPTAPGPRLTLWEGSWGSGARAAPALCKKGSLPASPLLKNAAGPWRLCPGAGRLCLSERQGLQGSGCPFLKVKAGIYPPCIGCFAP